ncbi:MAG: hypothetical protein J7K81_05560 [Methanophagales archaeon]|nr:hypothetical protein [Methanophagales archaeon]
MKIYLDTCVYCRPFDDQSQDRIEKETKAFIEIVTSITKFMGDRRIWQ